MIRLSVSDRVGEIRFDRAAEGNAFTGDMVRQMREALNNATANADILTLTGAGADFTIGRDRKEPKSGAPFDAFHGISELNRALAAFPGIIVAAVRGRAFGLGVGLVMRSDIAIAADDARFGLDEVSHGIPPMFIMEAILDHLAPKRALDIVLSSRAFDASEALAMGILSRIVAPAALDTTVRDYVKELRSRDRAVLLACKAYLRKVAPLAPEARSAVALVEQTQFAMTGRHKH